MEYFRITYNDVKDSVPWDFHVFNCPSCGDDKYRNSGVVEINLDDVVDLLGGNPYFETDGATSGYLDDVNYTLGMLSIIYP